MFISFMKIEKSSSVEHKNKIKFLLNTTLLLLFIFNRQMKSTQKVCTKNLLHEKNFSVIESQTITSCRGYLQTN